MKLPTSPSELISWIHSAPDPPPVLVAKVASILGSFTRVETIILLAILAVHDSGDAPAVTATVIERAGRSISHSQLDTLRKKGHLCQSQRQTKRTLAFAWSVTEETMPIIRQIDTTLRTFIARSNARIATQLVLSEITARYVGCDPARIHLHHTIGPQLGIDFTTDRDFITLLQDHFSIRLPAQQLKPIVTIADLLSLIRRLSPPIP